MPIASIGRIKVITVDYRMAPASRDVASVYAALLKQYRSEDIGIYGCSAGAILTMQVVAWLEANHLSRPGAVGIFCSAATGRRTGDSFYVGPLLNGVAVPGPIPKIMDYMASVGPDDPLAAPALHDEVLRHFPPALLLSGTRDAGLSPVLYAHARLIDLGRTAELHVWEGMTHCAFAQGAVDPDAPETRQAWKVIVRFFDRHLGKKVIR